MTTTNPNIITSDSYSLKLNKKLSDYETMLDAYQQSSVKIVSLQNATPNLVIIQNKIIGGSPFMTTKQPTKELCKSKVTGQYTAARYDRNQNCSLFTTDTPTVIDIKNPNTFAIIDELYSEKLHYYNLNQQLRVKCNDLIKTLESPDYIQIYNDIMQSNSNFLSELTSMSNQLDADRNEINQKTGLTLTQEMDELDATTKMSKLNTDSNYYQSSLFMFVVVIIIIGGIYLMVPLSKGAVQTGGGKLSKQSYFMIATLVLASIIINQLRIYRN